MVLVRWRPHTELRSFVRDPFFRRFFDVFDDFETSLEKPWYPRLDLVDEKDHMVATVELPGIDPKNVQIDLRDNILTVRGERQEDRNGEGSTYIKREQLFGSFTRTVQLPYRVDADKVKAQYSNGVLRITLPKSEQFVGRQIPVESSN